MTYDNFAKTAQAIFNSFPNEQVWMQGGLKPNRQLQQPEAGYCIVIRYHEKIIQPILHFMTQVRSVLPPIVEYKERELHTTIGTYGKTDMERFAPDTAILQHIIKSVEKGINAYPKNLSVKFERWLYNNETIIISGYPSRDLWCLFRKIASACQEDGYPLEMGRIIHVTTARFTKGISSQDFEQFRFLMEMAPAIETSKPSAIDIATWSCDGYKFALSTYKSYHL